MSACHITAGTCGKPVYCADCPNRPAFVLPDPPPPPAARGVVEDPHPGDSPVLQAIGKALTTVADLCEGRARWVMSVPARPDSDPDLVIAGALQAAKEALTAPKAPPLPVLSVDPSVIKPGMYLGHLSIRELVELQKELREEERSR